MGATRKLQGEIDRVLKKVTEGVDVFDSIWNKVYDTENANQKEKFEADLKKEIKKLQRYRDQIKTWIQSSEIKDKKALLDARKLIEREMERFKVCEKETKTKAFSKEGLGQLPKTDPREKAKGESRDWLNNMVSDLESQIDSFEAEMEGLSVKKGKARPPRLTHLEESISRHKQHIMKLELILRLLDNDELSPDEVNDVRYFVEEYVEHNQEDFEEFADVDNVYQSLSLDKMEALEALDAIPAITPCVLIKEKVGAGGLLLVGQLNTSLELLEDGSLQDLSTDSVSQSSPVPLSPTSDASPVTPLPAPVDGGLGATSALPRGLTPPTLSGLLSASKLSKPSSSSSLPSLPVPIVGRPKEEEGSSLAGRRVSSGILESGIGLARPGSSGRGSTGTSLGLQTAPLTPLSLGGTGLVGGLGVGAVPSMSDVTKRAGLVGEERIGGVSLSHQLGLTPNRIFGSPAGKVVDGANTNDSGVISDVSGRVFSPPVGSTGQWRPHSSQSQGETGQYNGRTEIAPDQKQKFLQRLQQVQQQQQIHSQQTLLQQIMQQQQQQPQQPFQVSAQQQQPQQQQQQTQPQTSQVKTDPTQLLTASSAPAQQQQTSLPQSSSQQLSQSSPATSSVNENEGKVSEQQPQLTEDNLIDTSTSALSTACSTSVSLVSEDDLKNADTFNVSVGGPGTLAELSQLSRDADFSPGQVVQQVQSPTGPGIIGVGRKEYGAIGDNLGTNVLGVNAAIHDQYYNKEALASAYLNIPQPVDSERPKNYIPRNPAVTHPSYPQVPVPIIDNPALWEHLDTEILFFAFYFQQGTYQQYLAARELKKQSWRYHKKYNTWFQRHEEPKITTDEFEQGTYVYFDFHIVHDDHQQGWCQRIKTEFTFEYSYLEDELIV